MDPWHLWLIAGIILVTLEMLTSGFFLALLGIAALGASLGAKFGLPFVWQLSLFVLISALLLTLVRPTIMAWLYRRSHQVPTNVDALIGKTGIVTDPSPDASSPGRVKIGSEEWRALSENSSSLPEGARVTVTQIDGNTLTVRELS